MGRWTRSGAGAAPSVPLIVALLLAPAVSVGQAEAPQTVEVTVTDSASAALEDRVAKLMRRPMDDPGHLELIQGASPDAVVQAAVAVGQRTGNRLGPLKVLLHGLTALLATKPAGYMQTFEAALAAVDRHYLPPDLLGSLDRIVAELDQERERVLEEASLFEKTKGLPLPRKKQMDATTGEVSPYSYGRLQDERKTLVNSEAQLAELRDRYPVLLGEMGVYYGKRSNLVLAFDCFSRCISMDYEAFQAEEARYTAPYIDAASFMILSAHRSDDVLALYHLAPLDPEPLQRKVLQQIEARTQIYARAADQFTNHASVNQALRDLLYTLIEDEGAIEFLPEQDRRRFLEDIGDTAIAKRHFQEAIGVYATLGETKKLIKLGKKLSKTVYTARRGQAFINRDVAWAIDAFREAGAVKEMSKLLDKVKEVQEDVVAGRLVADDPEVLNAYVRELDAYVNGGGGQEGLVLKSDTPEEDPLGVAPTPIPLKVSDEELPRHIHDYARQLTGAVPGEDVSYARDRLQVLAKQAEDAGQLELAVEAYQALGAYGDERVEAIVQDLIRLRRYEAAADLLIAYGPRGDAQLLAIADEILAQGAAPRGVFNANILVAVKILIHLDEVSRVEALLNELIKLRMQFAQLQNEAEISGRAIANRNLAQLEEAVKMIEVAYDVVGSGSYHPVPEGSAPTPTPAPPSAPSP